MSLGTPTLKVDMNSWTDLQDTFISRFLHIQRVDINRSRLTDPVNAANRLLLWRRAIRVMMSVCSRFHSTRTSRNGFHCRSRIITLLHDVMFSPWNRSRCISLARTKSIHRGRYLLRQPLWTSRVRCNSCPWQSLTGRPVSRICPSLHCLQSENKAQEI